MRNVLFLSHGSPSLVITEHPARDFFVDLGRQLPHPRGALVISAHYETSTLALGGAARPTTLHDFYGFPEVMYQQRYPAEGLPDMARQLAAELGACGLDVEVEPRRPLDHGVWSPLSLIWPQADIPLLPVSVPMALADNDRLALAAQLGQFAERHELWLIGSGAATHNLGDRKPAEAEPDPWAREFHAWARDVAERGDLNALANWRLQAPHATYAHPTPEHFLPLLMTVGALEGQPMKALHESFMFGNLSMLCLADLDTARWVKREHDAGAAA
jgi:4,5-DOPA dioxygenase extradiol